MLSKRNAQKIIQSLSDKEFDLIVNLLNQPQSALVAFLKGNDTSLVQMRVVAQGLVNELREGEFRLLDAIWDRLPAGDA